METKDMIEITVVDRRGDHHQLEAPSDMNLNLMELCKAHELPVEGTCGGMALCSSCHLYIESDHAMPDLMDGEEYMLDHAFFVEENSRLGCQIRLDEALDGLKIRLAPSAG